MGPAELYGEALSDWTIGAAATSALPLGFTNIDSRRTAETLARRVLALL